MQISTEFPFTITCKLPIPDIAITLAFGSEITKGIVIHCPGQTKKELPGVGERISGAKQSSSYQPVPPPEPPGPLSPGSPLSAKILGEQFEQTLQPSNKLYVSV